MNNTVTRQVLGKVMITSKGEYDSSKSYEILDVVTYQGSSYLSKKYNNDSLPTNANDWQLLAQKGDTYELSEEDLQRIAEQITSNANSAFNQNVKEKTDSFNSNASSKTEAYNTNATEKLGTYNSNHTAKLKEYNDNATSKLSAYNTNSVTKTTEYNSNHTNKLNAYDTNASNKVDVYNTNADTRLEEYNTNADNKIAEYDEHSKELNNKIVSTRNELERLKSNVLNTGEDTDTFIHLEDSAMAELQEIKVDGVCEQKTTTGKNKLDLEFSKESSTLAGMTFTHTKSGFTLNGTATGTWGIFTLKNNLPIVDGKTYSLSANIKGTNPKMQITLRVLNGSNKLFSISISNSNNYKGTVTANFTDEITKCEFVVEGLTVGEVYNLKAEVQFEESSAPTDYEPYTGGQPSPNPDYPQEIRTITDSLKVTSCGKNLFNAQKMLNIGGSDSNNCALISKDVNSVVLRYSSSWSRLSFKYKLKPNTQYWFSAKITDNTQNIFNGGVWSGNNQSHMLTNTLNTTIYVNFTTNNIGYIKLYFYPNYTQSMVPVNSMVTYDDIMIVEKKSETYEDIYEPYVESLITAKLSEGEFIGKSDETHKDTLRAEYNKDDGQYHLLLNKMIGKLVLDGSENISKSGATTNEILVATLNTNGLVDGYGISNYFIYSPYVGKNKFSIYNNGKSLRFCLDIQQYATIDDFKTWLSTHNTEVYYVLKTPYTLDLGAIDMPMSYKDITNIFTDSDLLPTINAKYYRVFDKTIQNAQINEKTLKQEITDLNATVSALDNRLKALETKIVEELTESEGTV